MKLTRLFHGNGEDAREAPRDPFGLATRDGAREAFLEGFTDGLGDNDLYVFGTFSAFQIIKRPFKVNSAKESVRLI